MKKILCFGVGALVSDVCIASIRNVSFIAPEDEWKFTAFVILLLTLPILFSVLGYWTGKTVWKVLGGLFTVPVAIVGLLLSSYGLELAVIPLLIALVNVFLLVSSRTAKNVL